MFQLISRKPPKYKAAMEALAPFEHKHFTVSPTAGTTWPYLVVIDVLLEIGKEHDSKNDPNGVQFADKLLRGCNLPDGIETKFIRHSYQALRAFQSIREALRYSDKVEVLLDEICADYMRQAV